MQKLIKAHKIHIDYGELNSPSFLLNRVKKMGAETCALLELLMIVPSSALGRFFEQRSTVSLETLMMQHCRSNQPGFVKAYSKIVHELKKSFDVPPHIISRALNRILFKNMESPPTSSIAEPYMMTTVYSLSIRDKEDYVPNEVTSVDVIHLTDLQRHTSGTVDITTVLMINPVNWQIIDVTDSIESISRIWLKNIRMISSHGECYSLKYACPTCDIQRSMPVLGFRMTWLGLLSPTEASELFPLPPIFSEASQARIFQQLVNDAIGPKPVPFSGYREWSLSPYLEAFKKSAKIRQVRKGAKNYFQFPFDIRQYHGMSIDDTDCPEYIFFIKYGLIKLDHLMEFIDSRLHIDHQLALNFVRPLIGIKVVRIDFFLWVLASIYRIISTAERQDALRTYCTTIAPHLPGMEDAGSYFFRRFHQICEQGMSFNIRCLNPLSPSPGLADYCLEVASSAAGQPPHPNLLTEIASSAACQPPCRDLLTEVASKVDSKSDFIGPRLPDS